MSSEFHQSYMSPLIHSPQSSLISNTPGTWNPLDFTVPDEKDRYWLFIPHPGYDYRLSWDGGTTYTRHTDSYITHLLQGIHKDEEVHITPDTPLVGTTIYIDYFLLLPFHNRIL